MIENVIRKCVIVTKKRKLLFYIVNINQAVSHTIMIYGAFSIRDFSEFPLKGVHL